MKSFDINPTVLSFTTAGIGGIAGWIVVHPFNTVSLRMNLASTSSSSSSSSSVSGQSSISFRSYLMNTIRKDGILSLYSGLSAGILRQVFYSTSRFGLFELFRDELAKYRSIDFTSRLVTGVISGGIAALISCPAEVTLVRISNDAQLPIEKRRNYKGVFNAFTRILNEEGIPAFFRGSGPFVSRAMLVGAVQVGTYDQFRDTFRKVFNINHQFLNVFCASMASGLLYSTVTMPFETSKNRMAFQKPDPSTGKLLYTSTIQTITTIAKKEGILKLWTGFAPYYLRCGGHTIIMFMSIEYIRKLLA